MIVPHVKYTCLSKFEMYTGWSTISICLFESLQFIRRIMICGSFVNSTEPWVHVV